jgi:perosamine synthetase
VSISNEPGAPIGQDVIPLCVPEIRGNELAYIKECLDGNFVSSVGPFVDRFEREMSTYVGTQFGVATATGTAALHVALLAAGIKPDDEVLVSTLTFVAPVNAIRYVGAWPVFIDAEPDYWQMDPQRILDFLEHDCQWTRGALRNSTTGRRVTAIMPVDILGHPVDMDVVLAAARKYGLVVIEDATESLGAKYKGQRIGHLADVACLSFNGNKIITAGGGGMIVTNKEDWARKAKYLTTQAKDDPLEYIHNEIGYNYRLTNVQAAMGVAQMEKLGEYVGIKRHIAAVYARALADVPGITPMREAEWAESIFWMFTVLVNEAHYGMDSRALLQRLAEGRIQARPLWQPIHLSRAHGMGQPGLCPIAERLNTEALSLPSSVGLNEADQRRVIETVRESARCQSAIGGQI